MRATMWLTCGRGSSGVAITLFFVGSCRIQWYGRQGSIDIDAVMDVVIE